jgi:hypothetical protein
MEGSGYFMLIGRDKQSGGGRGYNPLLQLKEETTMKKYLFGLGAMLVGAGLMFVLMHGEVSAEGESGIMHCKTYKSSKGYAPQEYCKTKEVTCVWKRTGGGGRGFSCVKN